LEFKIMAELTQKKRTAYHEAGHLFLAHNFRPSGILWTSIREVAGGQWEGDAKIRLTDVPDDCRAIIAVAGATAEARATAIGRFDNQAIELRVTDELVTQLSNFLGTHDPAAQLDISIHPIPDGQLTIETSISMNDAGWIAAGQRTAAHLKAALRDACDVCNDPVGWTVIRKLAKLIHTAAPKRVYNAKLRLKIEDTLSDQYP
jgi:hypothetical protein